MMPGHHMNSGAGARSCCQEGGVVGVDWMMDAWDLLEPADMAGSGLDMPMLQLGNSDHIAAIRYT